MWRGTDLKGRRKLDKSIINLKKLDDIFIRPKKANWKKR